MRSTVLTYIATFAIGIAAFACGVPQEQYDADIAALKRQVDDARGENADLRSKLEKMTAERQRLQGEIDKLNQALRDLTGERDTLAKAEALAKKRIDTFRDMLGKFKAMIESGKIKIRIADNKMLVEMASAILFPSGKARIPATSVKASLPSSESLALPLGNRIAEAISTSILLSAMRILILTDSIIA
ncbi:MAG: hypothetical protein R6V85_14845, partial [Polyangia bacterium]